MTTTATTTAVDAAPSVLPAPAPTGGIQVVVIEVPDDDVPPPRWGQWESLPAPAPEPPVGMLVMREDGRVMSGHPTHDAEASSSRAALPASGGTAARPEQEEEHVNARLAHFREAQAEHTLWEEFRGHGTSLNWVLNEALWIHGDPAWRIFPVCDFSPDFAVLPLLFLLHLRFP
jgi:hypothetical protein